MRRLESLFLDGAALRRAVTGAIDDDEAVALTGVEALAFVGGGLAGALALAAVNAGAFNAFGLGGGRGNGHGGAGDEKSGGGGGQGNADGFGMSGHLNVSPFG